ncbi:MAG TPA: stage III sporulation protein AE [Lachnospiraceae bacterium]|nr:stage III sporulation protein AE [Lachnospiraceae bacterium]
MRKKVRGWKGWAVCFLLICCFTTEVWGAAGETLPGAQEDETGPDDELLAKLDLQEIQDAVDSYLQEDTLSVSDLLRKLMDGEISLEDLDWREIFLAVAGQGLGGQRALLGKLLFLILLSAVFSIMADVFAEDRVGETGFYILYLLLLAFLLEEFGRTGSEVEELLLGVSGFMEAAAPAYYLAVLTAGGATTAGLFYQLLLLLLLAVQSVIVRLLLPGVQIYVLLNLVNQIPREDFLSRLTDLIRTCIQWSMKTMIAAVTGLQILRNMLGPALDSLHRSAIGRTAGAIPGIGNMINATTEILLASAVLIRNCLGVAVLVILLWGCLMPVARMAVRTLMFKMLGAFCQPVADERIVGCLGAIADGYGMYLHMVLGTVVMFLLSVAVLTGT